MAKPAPYAIRRETEASQNALSKALIDWFTEFGPPGMYQTCATCKSMVQGNAPAHCQKWNLTPPIDIIMRGCPEYKDTDEIPF